jgi:hypothetical protein
MKFEAAPNKSRCATKPSLSGSNGIRVEDPRYLYIRCPSTFERQPELKTQAKEPKTQARPSGISTSGIVFTSL